MKDSEITSELASEEEISTFGNSTRIDEMVSRGTQIISRGTESRRSFLGKFARFALAMTGAALIPVLPINREEQIAHATAPNCNSWEMCGIYALRVCQCACGSNDCPSETSLGNNPWSGCCPTGIANQHLRVWYYDCCCSGSCNPSCCNASNCECYRGSYQDLWCGGVAGANLCCTKVVVAGHC